MISKKIEVILVASLLRLILFCYAEQIKCGVPRVEEKHLIVRGHQTRAEEWPWHATILHRSSRRPPEYACGGSLISQHLVLTAKHCTLSDGSGHPLTGKAISVQLGINKLYQFNTNNQEHQVIQIHVPDKFCCDELKNDIALLELRTVVQFNKFVLPVCLPDRDVTPGELGTVVGFGSTELDEVSLTLIKTRLPVIETGKCLRSDRIGWGGILDEGLFCAGYLNGTAVCNGDSGGGLMFKRGDSWQVAGVVSVSLGKEDNDWMCKHDGFGGFTKVHKYLEWIRHVAQSRDDNFGNVNVKLNLGNVPDSNFKLSSSADFNFDFSSTYHVKIMLIDPR